MATKNHNYLLINNTIGNVRYSGIFFFFRFSFVFICFELFAHFFINFPFRLLYTNIIVTGISYEAFLDKREQENFHFASTLILFSVCAYKLKINGETFERTKRSPLE